MRGRRPAPEGAEVKLAYVTTVPITQWVLLRGQNRFMRERGFRLHAITSPGAELDALQERDGAVLHPVPISRSIDPLRDAVSLVRLYAALRRIRPQIVHLSTPKAALLGSIAARLAGVPVRVFMIRGTVTEGATGIRRRLFRRLERWTAALCTHHVCVAPSLLEFVRAEGILRPDQGVVPAHGMSNGIDAERFSPGVDPGAEEGGAVIGFLGRLARDKGVGDLAEAWWALREEFPRARLLLVGPWEDEDPVPPGVRRRLEEDPRVEITGGVDDVVPQLRRMSVFAFPSHGTEGFPNAPMEAAALGLPVVATRVVGCVDAVREGETGALVPPNHPAALADALRAYLAAPGLRRRHGAAGRERVLRDFRRELIWEALYRQYLGELRRVGVHPPAPAAALAPTPTGAAP